MKALCAFALALLAASAVSAAETLDIYVLDVEGGKSMILMTPDGESMLVDGGYPTRDGRDTNRIVSMAESLGLKQFDYILSTHYDADHSGNVAAVDAKIPGKVFIDHGDPIPTLSPMSIRSNYDPYVKAIGDRKRITVKPGDVLPLKGITITVVSAGGKVLAEPLPGADQENELSPASRPTYQDRDDNAGSVGLLYEFGKFRMLDLADLLTPIEYDLMCPKNKIGTVDLFMVSHHGFAYSNSKFLIHALRPRVSIMNNATRKGGDPPVLEILKTSPGIEDRWQLHNSPRGGDNNAPEELIANPTDPCEGKLIKVSVQRDGTFTVTNTRNDVSKTYKPKPDEAVATESDN